VEDFIKDVDFNRVSSPLAQAGFATGEILMMSTDLLSMNYEGARDRRWSASAARLAGPKRRSQRIGRCEIRPGIECGQPVLRKGTEPADRRRPGGESSPLTTHA
jgi:hypothetical protein